MLRASLLVSRSALVVVPLAALSLVAPAAHAQPLLFTLSGVTFQDGGTASGSFVRTSSGGASGTITDFNITTSAGTIPLNGASLPAAGSRYVPGSVTATDTFGSSFTFTTQSTGFSARPSLKLALSGFFSGPGTYALMPGTATSATAFSNSGEFTADNARGITGGNLIVTSAVAGPEPASIALLLVAGVPVVGLVRRRKATR